MQEMLKQFKLKKNLYYLPNQGNLGDCLIAAATYNLFDKIGLNYQILNKIPQKKFTLIYGGGGLWTNDYQKNYQKILNIFKSKNLEKCIILPSSFNMCDDLLEILDERFIVYAREERSFNYLKNSSVKSEIYLADDMVINADISELQRGVKNKYFVSKNIFENIKIYRKFYLKIDKQIRKAFKKYDSFKIGYFLRDDVEKTIDNKPYNNFDLSNCKSDFWINKKLTYAVAKIFIDTIDKFEIIVTDRLHIAICAILLNKRVYLIDNSYGKLSAVYKYSLKDRNNAELIKYEDLNRKY